MKPIKIYIRGWCSENEFIQNVKIGSGGYGFVITDGDKKVYENSHAISKTKIQRIQMLAIIEALQSLHRIAPIQIFCPNQIIVNAYEKNWINSWRESNFKYQAHGDLWLELDSMIQNIDAEVEFIWMKLKDFNSPPEMRRADDIMRNTVKKGSFVVDKAYHNSILAALNIEELKEDDLTKIEIEKKRYADKNSLCVSAQCKGEYGEMEYKGVHTGSKELLFHVKGFEMGTKNTGDFLSIVHALAQAKKDEKEQPIIYTASEVAISWVRDKSYRTNLIKDKKSEKLFDYLERAVKWLDNNDVDFNRIRKWESKIWGKIPSMKQ